MNEAISSIGAGLVALNNLWFQSGYHKPDSQIIVQLDDEALHLFEKWELERQAESRTLDAIECPAFGGWLAKSDKPQLSMALSILLWELYISSEIFSTKVFTIKKTHLEQAQMLCQYLKERAKALYHSQELEQDLVVARKILERIKNGDITEGLSIRDIKHAHYPGLKNSKLVNQGIALLEECGYIKIVEIKTGGRSSKSILINPEFKKSKIDKIVTKTPHLVSELKESGSPISAEKSRKRKESNHTDETNGLYLCSIFDEPEESIQ
jgi:hypothetical protein